MKPGGTCAFVDADQPHAVVYPKTLTVTFALWSSKKAVTWRDHVKRLPGVRGREKSLRDLALKLGLRKTLDLKTCEYYDYYPADGAFKGMRQRVQFQRGPNEDYLQSFFNVLQETGNERLIPLIFESVDGKKLDNPEVLRRLAADLRAGKRVPNKYSDGIHTNVPHMNFRAADVVKNLPRATVIALRRDGARTGAYKTSFFGTEPWSPRRFATSRKSSGISASKTRGEASGWAGCVKPSVRACSITRGASMRGLLSPESADRLKLRRSAHRYS